MTRSRFVDHRFADLVKEILSRKWIVQVELRPYQLAQVLGVSRTTVYCWETQMTGISREVAEANLGEPGVAGYFARRVLEIYDAIDQEKKKKPRTGVKVCHTGVKYLSNLRRYQWVDKWSQNV